VKLSCSNCGVDHDQVYSECPECGFTYPLLDQYYTDLPPTDSRPILELLNDPAGILNVSDRVLCKDEIREFCRRFPAMFFSVYLDASGDNDDADSKSLWLYNKADFSALPAGAHVQYGVLLYIDANKKEASISFGDGLSPYMDGKESFQLLKGAHTFLYRGKYLLSIQHVLRKLTAHLIRKFPK